MRFALFAICLLLSISSCTDGILLSDPSITNYHELHLSTNEETKQKNNNNCGISIENIVEKGCKIDVETAISLGNYDLPDGISMGEIKYYASTDDILDVDTDTYLKTLGYIWPAEGTFTSLVISLEPPHSGFIFATVDAVCSMEDVIVSEYYTVTEMPCNP